MKKEKNPNPVNRDSMAKNIFINKTTLFRENNRDEDQYFFKQIHRTVLIEHN